MEVFDSDSLRRLGSAARHAEGAPDRPAGDRAEGRLGSAPWLGARILGALAVLATGAVHLQQYLWLYSAIPTIGTLFVLNFAAATVIGLGLLAPVERAVGDRLGAIAVGLLATAGIGMAATAFAFLAVSEHTPLFGFMEPGYDPTAIAAARVSELVSVVSLTGFLVGRFAIGARMGRW
jgi:hypothetical protein